MVSEQKITIAHYDGPNQTPAALIMARAQYELMRDGMMTHVFVLGWDDQVFVATGAEEEVVGIISYQYQKWAKHIDLKIGYVIPECRGHGYYRQLWDALVVKAQELGAVEIMGNTHMDNYATRAAAKAFGRYEAGVVLRYTVPLKMPIDAK